tara:strand:+ start:1494 stop:4433 length:2940 start_codon:yes stop_codon:yes gene_type:complete
MNIKIPQRFDEKLTGNYRAFIDGTISNFSVILQDNKLEFFQEFTDHGTAHIEEVLNTACNLISDESFEFLNEKDIAVLIMAVILHDVGMHISSEGLKKILDKDYDQNRVQYFDSLSWDDKWNEFFYEAKRFNDEQLTNIFGTSKIEVSEPDINNLDESSKKLYGEFLRRHHARLAHEISHGGFPTKIGEKNISTNTNIDKEIIDICGLVARSHGMHLRKSFDYLKDKHGETWNIPYDIKVFFLMTVLRIADYIQIHSARANTLLVKTKRFSSPISKKEWEKHNSIKDISVKTADPERIFVTAKPENSLIYLELRKLFDDIQSEFDISWAILGEVYGKDEELKNLKLKYRRLTSNLDNIVKFEDTVKFIPEKIRFDADPELLKLLIGPLYGEDPKYGVRELLQNSVDAVKERAYIEKSFEQNIQILLEELELGSQEYYLTIKDNGIGMAKDTIINFFFRAGASFRNSMFWKKSFVEDSEVKIEKTGRFGVGVLAAFLLGDEFELFTKHHKSENGFQCKASLSTTQVELLKTECEIGTYIKIKLKKEINEDFQKLILKNKNLEQQKISSFNYRSREEINKLEWFNWYVMDLPRVELIIKNDKLKNIFSLSNLKISSTPEITSKGWYKFSTKEFKSIHWTIDYNSPELYYNSNSWKERKGHKLYCNGFKVVRGYKLPEYPWSYPTVSVFDGNAKMPLSLSRDYLLNDRLPFENELIDNVCFKIIDVLNKTEFNKRGEYWVPQENILEFSGIKIDLSKFIVVSGDKFTLMTPFIAKSLGLEVFYQVWLKDFDTSNFTFLDEKVFYQALTKDNDPNYFYKNLLEPRHYGESSLLDWFSLGQTQRSRRGHLVHNDYLLNDKLTYMLEKNRLTKSFRDSIKSQLFNDRWTVIKNVPTNTQDDFLIEEEIMNINIKLKEKKKKTSHMQSDLDKSKLIDSYYYFIKEYFIDKEQLSGFDRFKDVWTKLYGDKDFLIPINKEYRKMLNK